MRKSALLQIMAAFAATLRLPDGGPKFSPRSRDLALRRDAGGIDAPSVFRIDWRSLLDRSKYEPHQGIRECARRRRQHHSQVPYWERSALRALLARTALQK